jgi:hypothetical protein
MPTQRTDCRFYVVLVLATVAAIASAERAGDPYRQAHSLLLTTAAGATALADAIAENVDENE